MPADTMQEIKSLAGRHLNMVRSETGILAAFAEVERMETEAVSNFSVQGETDKETAANIRRAIEAEGQLKLCRLLGAASLEREESRGGFFGGAYRAEFPAQDDENWLRNVVLKKENGSITARSRLTKNFPPRSMRSSRPPGKPPTMTTTTSRRNSGR